MTLAPTDTRSVRPITSNPVRAADTPGIAGMMTVIVGVVILAGLYLGKDVLIPIVFAVLISFVLSPIVNFLRKIGLPRVVAVILAALTGITAAALLVGILGLQFAALVNDFPRYRVTVERKLENLNDGPIGRIGRQIAGFSRSIEDASDDAEAGAEDRLLQSPSPGVLPSAEAGPDGSSSEPVIVQVEEKPLGTWGVLSTYGERIAGPLTEAAITFVVVIFILLQRADLRDRVIRLFGSSDLHKTTAAMDDAAKRLARYFLLQVGLATIYGVVTAVVLWLIGVPAPILFGVLAGLMRFVPYVGTVIAIIPPVALAAAVDPGWSLAIWTLVAFVVMEGLQGHVVEPLVYGTSTGLSPVAVVVAAIFWTWLWGPIGLLVSTPLTLLLVVLGRHVERLEFLDVIFGDRPALSPAENFYQRTLAGDADELVGHAEQLLKDRSLSSYYDEVAIGGLQIAVKDRVRGVLTDDQVELIRATVAELVDELADAPDFEPAETVDENAPVAPSDKAKPVDPDGVDDPVPPAAVPERWKQPGSVLCVAGKGRLDQGVTLMVAQLIEKHGIGARSVDRDAVSRHAIDALDIEGVRLICVSYLDATGYPSHARGLVQRLKRRAPGVPILLGLWPEGDPVLTDRELQKRIGVDYFVTSLRKAVETVIFHATAEAQLHKADLATAAE